MTTPRPSDPKDALRIQNAKRARADSIARRRGMLTDQQKIFINEFMLDLNAKRAALRSGYSENYADKVVPLWVGPNRDKCPPKFRHVWDQVNAAKLARLERTQFDSDKVLTVLGDVAEADLARAFDEDGKFLPIHLIPPEVRRLVAGIKMKQVKKDDEVAEILTDLWQARSDIDTALRTLLDSGELDPLTQSTLKEISRINEEARKQADVLHVFLQPELLEVKFYSRLDAIGMIGKHVKVQAFKDQVKHDLPLPPSMTLPTDPDKLNRLALLADSLNLVEALAAQPIDVTPQPAETPHAAPAPQPAAADYAGTVPGTHGPEPGGAGLYTPAG